MLSTDQTLNMLTVHTRNKFFQWITLKIFQLKFNSLLGPRVKRIMRLINSIRIYENTFQEYRRLLGLIWRKRKERWINELQEKIKRRRRRKSMETFFWIMNSPFDPIKDHRLLYHRWKRFLLQFCYSYDLYTCIRVYALLLYLYCLF